MMLIREPFLIDQKPLLLSPKYFAAHRDTEVLSDFPSQEIK